MQKSFDKSQKLANLDDAKNKLSNNKIYISENLSNINENIAFEARKLKRKEAIHVCLKKDSVVHIKLGEHGKSIKTLDQSYFNNHILDCEDKDEDLFHEVSDEANNVIQPSY